MPYSSEMPAPVRTTTRGLFILPPVQILPCMLAGCRGPLQGAAAGRQPGGENPLHHLPANSRIQGSPSTGWRPEGHRTTTASTVWSVLFFQKAPAHRSNGKLTALRPVWRSEEHTSELQSRGQ